MSLGECIAWGPLGPGGDPAMSLQGLAGKREAYRQLRGTRPHRMGEVIQWAPLGPGGDPQMSIQGLAALSPGSEQLVDASMAQLETTDMQVYNEIADAYASNVDVANDQLLYDGLLDRLIAAQATTVSLEDDDWPAFNDQVVGLQADYDTLLRKLQAAREGRHYGTQITGLAWGVGASAAAAGVLWLVWRNRKKKR